jgi:hypothetical protein
VKANAPGVIGRPRVRQPVHSTSTRNRPSVVNKLGVEYFVVSSDYPHSDGAFPQAIEQFLSLSLSDEQRGQILWDNCARLYAIKTPARPLSAEPRAPAAE